MIWKYGWLHVPTSRSLSRDDWQVISIWLALRLLTGAWAALVAWLTPPVDLGPLHLPGSSSTWFERALVAPWERWDVSYYVRIVAQGYRVDDGTAQFHPLLAWLATPLAWTVGSPLFALLLVSSAAGLLLLPLFERLARIDLDPADARTATLLFAFAPPAFILYAPYTEGLWLLCAVLCLLCARRRAWWWAGLAGALATLTRQQGVFLLVPLAWELWEAADRSTARARRAWRDWLSLGLIPAGLLVWLVYRALALNDLRADLRDPQALIYSLLVSPSASKVVPRQALLWPWQALTLALEKLWTAPEYDLAIDLALGAGFLALLGLAWRGMRASYRLYALAITLVSFGYYTGPFYPYMGLPRHLLLAFPVFIGLAPLLRHGWLRLLAVVGGMLGMLLLLFLYEIHGWVP